MKTTGLFVFHLGGSHTGSNDPLPGSFAGRVFFNRLLGWVVRGLASGVMNCKQIFRGRFHGYIWLLGHAFMWFEGFLRH